MIKMKIKEQKGITLMTLALAITIMVIISSTLIYSAQSGIKTRALNNMYNDINILKEKVDIYFSKYGKIPVLETSYTSTNEIPTGITNMNPNDNSKYYVIDLETLENLTLNYGTEYKDYKQSPNVAKTDLYIINEQSHNIYYVKGIKLDDKTYYTIPGDYTKVNVPSVNQINLLQINGNIATIEISAIDKTDKIQSISLYVNDELYKKYDYTEELQYERKEIIDIILPFYEETNCYINITSTKLNTQQSNTINIKNENAIATANDMKKLAEVVNGGQTFEGKTIYLLSDINLEGNESNQWEPIGNTTNKFLGTFDGKGHDIYNIYIDTQNSYQGLFGYNAGTIKNVGIATGTIKAAGYSGSIVGHNEGIIQKCYNNIDLYCYGGLNFGGIAGRMSRKSACISKSYNKGNITGEITSQYGSMSGIVGTTIDNAVIEYCYNVGNITNTTSEQNVRANGITNGNAIVKSCYNTGNITLKMTSTKTYPVAAGIMGQLHGGGIYNSYNIGTTTIETTVSEIRNAGITGYYDANTEIKNCFWLSSASASGIAGKSSSVETEYEATQIDTEEEMKNIFSELGEDYKEDTNNINNGYPILKWQEL